MWVPRTWADLERALGVQTEGDGLDFKSALPPKNKMRDLAKDAAAMSIGGGTIVIGVDETSGIATKISPLALDGAVERVQQVIDANVAPTIAVGITQLREHEGDPTGVLVIEVPASWSAPHEYDRRFPARSGATTRYLNEREVEALYLRRWELRQQSQGQVGMQGHRLPPGVRLDLAGEPIGVMRLHIRPLGDAHPPQEPHMREPLREAVEAAAAAIGQFIHPSFHPKSLELVRNWSPASAYGWRAGAFLEGAPVLSELVGGMYTYGGGFSFTVTIDLAAGLEPGAPANARCAHEHHWAIETMALLGIAGNFFAPFPEASLLRVDLELGGLLDSVSWQASRGLAFNSGAPRVRENLYSSGSVFAARELAADPRDATRILLDPFMVAILSEESDLVGWVETLRYQEA